MEKIELKKMQEIQNINIDPADNGGCVLCYTVYTPHSKHSDSQWDNHKEVYSEDAIDTALDRVKELYKASLAMKKAGVGSSDEPKGQIG